ncbi:MAG TPA: VWA domain-containing protein [Acidobacteriaceae bacterium]|nr:VWA domain-containing protein [Acidobacteriaceae bacterium]
MIRWKSMGCDRGYAHRRSTEVYGWAATAFLLVTFALAAPCSRAAQSTPAPPPPSGSQPAATQPQQQQQQQPLPQAVQANGQNGNGAFTITSVVNEVNLLFTVTDKHGHFIRNLKESDFSLLDDRMPPAEVYSFTQQTNLPLRVGLMIDSSNSIRSRFHFEQSAATEFLLEILRPQFDKAFVMGFDVTPDITQPFTNNADLLSAGIRKLAPGGGTALYDAVYTACKTELLPLRGPTALRKAIILVSDGDDNQSHATLDDAVKMCQRADTIIYAISTNDSPTRDRGDEILKDMALVTGGSAFYPPRIEQVAEAFESIQDELRSQYSLVYKPADFKADGAFRPIFLTAYDKKYKVRVQKGYFAPSPTP